MARNKRNRVSTARQKIFSLPKVVYTVRCPGSHCDCKQFGPDCRRGFFSLWIEAVYGMQLADRLQIGNNIDYGDKPYLYSDPAGHNGEMNFWNYYYEQQLIQDGERIVQNNYLETYPLRIWRRSHFRKVYESAVSKLRLRKTAKEYIRSISGQCKKYKTLGIHLRGTDHKNEVPAVPFERVLRTIGHNKERYEKFFIATDDNKALDRIIQKLGKDRLILQDAVRSDNDQAVHTNMLLTDRYRLGLEVLADCYALSACNKAILVHSNVSYGALLINPELKYKLLETKDSRQSRIKTGLLYDLDRWGIRKM